MAPVLNLEQKAAILALSSEHYSVRKIVAALKKRDILVSESSVALIIDNDAKERAGILLPEKSSRREGYL